MSDYILVKSTIIKVFENHSATCVPVIKPDEVIISIDTTKAENLPVGLENVKFKICLQKKGLSLTGLLATQGFCSELTQFLVPHVGYLVFSTL